MVNDRNFGLLEVTGPLKERVLTITIQDRTGAVRWKRAIPASELK